MKKLVSLMLTVVLLGSLVCCYASAAAEDDAFKYDVKEDGTLCITSAPESCYNASTGILTIPSEIDNMIVTEIAPYAFTFFADNVVLSLPNTLQKVDKFAFFNLKIKQLIIPSSLVDIQPGAIMTKTSGAEFVVDNGNPNYAVVNGLLCDKNKKEIVAGTSTSDIPEGIVSIGDYAFLGLSVELENFPASLTKIGEGAFQGCTIGKFDIPNIVEIGPGAFWDATCKPGIISGRDSRTYQALGYYRDTASDICIYATVIGENAFKNFKVGEYCSYNNMLGSGSDFVRSAIRLYDCTAIGEGAFSDCDCDYIDLRTSESITSIPPFAFNNVNISLKNDSLNPEITEIPSAFNAPNYVIGSTIKRIDSEAFQFHVPTDYLLPSTLEFIAPDAFKSYTSFTVEPGSYAEQWCKDIGASYKYASSSGETDTSWLNQ